MRNIYEILSKHFLGEADEEENNRAEEYRRSNPEEYALLKSFWTRRLGELKHFDTEGRWKALQRVVTEKERPVVPLYRRLQRMAAAVILLVALSLTAYYGYRHLSGVTLAQSFPDQRETPVMLRDGTQIWLNTGAVLSYPWKFGKKERKVSLKGEAYFEVTHDPAHPFTVETINGSVAVLGTSFNIFSGKDSLKVTVATGKVRVTNAENTGGVIITPGYKAVVSGSEVKKRPATDPNYLAWKTGEFIFRDTPVREVIRQLNKYYNNCFEVKESDLCSGCLLTAHFQKARPEDNITKIELTCDIIVTLTGTQTTH